MSYALCIYLCDAALWLLLCNALVLSSQEILNTFTKGIDYVHRCPYHPKRFMSLWSRLNELIWNMGNSFSGKYIIHLIFSFINVTTLTYFIIFPPKYIQLGFFLRMTSSIMLAMLLFMEIHFAHSAADEVTRKFTKELQALESCSITYSEEIRLWIRRISERPPKICLSGFVTVNKKFSSTLLVYQTMFSERYISSLTVTENVDHLLGSVATVSYYVRKRIIKFSSSELH
ncbi:hypothetical protein C0J52_01919 [Blattella germanica]|nr:hypothetical protein C0J52_01919 [Blattella germanica]